MKGVEEQYREAIGGWSGRRRVERSQDLLSEVREMLARKVVAREPELTPSEVRRRVAEQLYGSDRETLCLLSRLDS
ncbi:MAG: hypothetical protein F4112_04525 [Holophagales bacterium]|nr:hypothetical protein [Holophagales bacterium]MYD22804.1 hypothetical protein [Holophagales bacterium]MYI32222.1 hypothetical protein [Holophagales bacterium]